MYSSHKCFIFWEIFMEKSQTSPSTNGGLSQVSMKLLHIHELPLMAFIISARYPLPPEYRVKVQSLFTKGSNSSWPPGPGYHFGRQDLPWEVKLQYVTVEMGQFMRRENKEKEQTKIEVYFVSKMGRNCQYQLFLILINIQLLYDDKDSPCSVCVFIASYPDPWPIW